MAKKVVLFGGSFDPPGEHHFKVAKALARYFDKVIVIPCGGRPDKRVTGEIDPIHRAAMCDLTFGKIPKVEVALFDLENNQFTPAWKLDEIYSVQGEV